MLSQVYLYEEVVKITGINESRNHYATAVNALIAESKSNSGRVVRYAVRERASNGFQLLDFNYLHHTNRGLSLVNEIPAWK